MATDLSNWSNFASGKDSPEKKNIKKIIKCDTWSISEILSKAEENRKNDPLDIEWVVTELFGLKIQKTDLGDTTSGFLNQLDDGWCIFVNKYENERRQRFTIAHELGHFLLHKSKPTFEKDFIFFRDNNNNKEEREANDFAAELLMPENYVRDYIAKGNNTIKLLADKFYLSTPAVKYRVYKLGLISEY